MRTVTNIIVWVVGIVGVVLLIAMTAKATDFNEHLWFNTGNYDSVRCVLYIDRSGSLVEIDSNSVTSFPGATLFGLWNDSSYQIQFRWYYNDVTTEGGMRNINYVALANAVLGGGAGDYTVDFYVFDTSGGDTVPVNQALVSFRNWGLTAPIKTPTTDVNGLARIATNADSVAVRATAPLYTFPTDWDSVTYSADYTDSIYGYLDVPAAAAGVNWVAAYIDIGSGIIDSATGLMIPRTGLRWSLTLVGEPTLNDGTWAYAPKVYQKQPDSDGRTIFYVPANTPLTPAGSYYILTYTAWDGSSLRTSEIRKFILDTIPDPVNILNTTKVW